MRSVAAWPPAPSRAHKLPDVPIFQLLWRIPDKFGGLTNAALHRASMLAEWGDRNIDILLIGPEPAPTVTSRLRESGLINERVRLRSMWAELATLDDKTLAALPGASVPVVSVNDSAASKNVDGARVDRRADGSLVVADTGSPRSLNRTLTLYDHTGRAVSQWESFAHLCHAWLDQVFGQETSILLSDSPLTGGFVHNYRRGHVTVLQALHNNHVDRQDASKLSPAKGKFFELLTHADHLDRFITLTVAQRSDMQVSLIGTDNLTTVPNAFAGEILRDVLPRRRGRGIVTSRLVPLKRLDHAIRIISAVEDRESPTFDVYGSGPVEGDLKALTYELGIGASVTFHGFDLNARAAYADASFTLLTSISEGQPLVLLEAMAAGCIPIAYDIDYGPSDIITDGINGFLIPPGDIEAATSALQRFLTMSESHVHAMREAAVHRAADFQRDRICEAWGRTFHEAIESKVKPRKVRIRPEVEALSMAPTGVEIEITVTGKEASKLEWALFTWRGRTAEIYGRVCAEVDRQRGVTRLRGLLPAQRLMQKSPTTLDIYVDVRARGTAARRRIKVPESLSTPRTDGMATFRTVNGNLSIRIAAPPS